MNKSIQNKSTFDTNFVQGDTFLLFSNYFFSGIIEDLIFLYFANVQIFLFLFYFFYFFSGGGGLFFQNFWENFEKKKR